jgi:ribose transport system permease protein
VALGEGVVILTAGVDLSVGGVLSLGTVIAATRFTDTGNSILWSFVILIIGIGAGCLNGFIIGRLHLQPFIVTLATWSIFDGVALIILPIQGGTVPGGFAAWINNSAFKVPNAVWALLVLAVLWLWFRRTRTAAHIYALGSNREAAIIAGVNPTRTLIRAYAISGFCAALASIAYAMLTASGSPTAGDALILPAVAAVVIGGTSLSGGRGGFIGTIAGALALTLLGDVVFVLNLSSYWTQFASGLLLLVAVLFGVVVERLQARRVSVQLT